MVLCVSNIYVCFLEFQLDLWGKKGLDMLASQSLDEIQSSDGASKALEQIERFISSGDGLSIGKTNKLNRLAKKLDNQELNERVKNALERTREISEMLEKRENRWVRVLTVIIMRKEVSINNLWKTLVINMIRLTLVIMFCKSSLWNWQLIERVQLIECPVSDQYRTFVPKSLRMSNRSKWGNVCIGSLLL